MRDIWQTLYDAGADIVVNGHDHVYERFAPQDPNGRADAPKGIREFVVGTGGASLYPFLDVQPNSEARMASFSVLKLTLMSVSYVWEFVSTRNAAILESGAGTRH